VKKLEHLSKIYTSYDTFIIDLWGVMHNGITLNDNAIHVANQLLKNLKKIVFLSNAPRPTNTVINFLKKINMEEDLLKNVVTSGEAALNAINTNKYGESFFHLGPTKDQSLYKDVKKNKTEITKSDYILCTGLLDDHEEDLEYHKMFLKKWVSKKLICTNPDLIVHRGKKKEYCAGAVAEIFESLGGTVVYFGKPHKEIYNMCFKNGERVLAIGDNLKTDIKGANNLKIDSVFITNGIHKSEFKNANELESLLTKYKVQANYFQSELTW